MAKNKEKLTYIFPNVISKIMKKIDMRTQLESSMLSMFMIICGMTLMAIYLIWFGTLSWVYKGLILLNLGAGFIFISSFLVTTYQQYVSYMEMAKIDPEEHKREIKKKGNIFKRIRIAYKNKKSKSNPNLDLVKEAVENMIKFKQEEMEEYKKLKKKAEELKKNENDKSLKGGEK